MANPFFPGKPVPPEHFVGRTSEVNFAFDQICARSHFALWGGPGMGKTSFLRKLASEQALREHGIDPSEVVIVLLSCENIIPFTPAGFWREVLTMLCDQLDSEPQLQAEIKPLLENTFTNDSLRQALGRLGNKGKFLLLLVDDLDAALVSNDQYTEAEMGTFLAQCRNLAVAVPESQYLSMIVTSLQPLSQPDCGPKPNPNASPWYNHYLFQSLKLFTTSELVELLTIIRPPTLRGEIINITGGHPTLVQTAGFLLWGQIQPGNTPNIKTFARGFERDTQQIFQTIWDRCSEIDQALLMLIALLDMEGHIEEIKFNLSGIGRILTQHRRWLSTLEDRGVITSSSTDTGTFYSFTSSLMKKWVTEEILKTSNTLVKDREKEFLNLISHGQVGKVKEVVTWLGNHPENVKSVLDWIAKVVPVFPK